MTRTAFRFLIAGSLALLTANPAAAEAVLRPFSLQYEVVFRGMSAGSAELDLQPESNGRWRYSSVNEARGLFRLAFPGEISQTSILRQQADEIVPLQYRADDGSTATARDISLDFDYDNSRLRGTAENKSVDLPLTPGVQDPLSVQISVMLTLANGKSPQSYLLIDKQEIKRYDYRYEGQAKLTTPAGDFDTVIWSSSRVGSSRRTRVWYAPSLGYLPLQAERRKGEQVEWSMGLRRLKSSAE